MAVLSAHVTVASTAATVIFTADSDGNDLAVQNISTGQVWVGGASVSTGNGFALSTAATVSLTLGPSEAVYGIAQSTDRTVAYIKNR